MEVFVGRGKIFYLVKVWKEGLIITVPTQEIEEEKAYCYIMYWLSKRLLSLHRISREGRLIDTLCIGYQRDERVNIAVPTQDIEGGKAYYYILYRLSKGWKAQYCCPYTVHRIPREGRLIITLCMCRLSKRWKGQYCCPYTVHRIPREGRLIITFCVCYQRDGRLNIAVPTQDIKGGGLIVTLCIGYQRDGRVNIAVPTQDIEGGKAYYYIMYRISKG